MFVIMVRGLLSKLCFPYAQFAATTLSGDMLFDPIWEAVSRLEKCGFKVLTITADGASSNRSFLRFMVCLAPLGTGLSILILQRSATFILFPTHLT